MPIRDALKRLEGDGLVVSDETGRYTVVRFGTQDVDEVYAIRRRLEPFAVELAVRAMTPEAMRRIESLFAELGKVARRRQLDRYSEINVSFHMAIYEASRMPRLTRMIRGLYVGVFPLTPIMLEGRVARSQQEHEEIMARLAERDAAGAARAMDRHIENAGAELREFDDQCRRGCASAQDRPATRGARWTNLWLAPSAAGCGSAWSAAAPIRSSAVPTSSRSGPTDFAIWWPGRCPSVPTWRAPPLLAN